MDFCSHSCEHFDFFILAFLPARIPFSVDGVRGDFLTGEESPIERSQEVTKMKKKWCGQCPIWLKHAWTMVSCSGPCPEEAYVEVDEGD